ncbi:MAG: FKBP-type peptidyl-prolyl cis-trans isomerase [Gammaproteobacteria bacterium]|nr:MAG: FKBP-type peptidyl-prolyl cis-trans isomerase [Gammaproteobacteria bacterium]
MTSKVKHLALYTVILAFYLLNFTTANAATKNDGLESDSRRASYTMGLKMGRYIRANNFDGFNIESLYAGIRDGIENKSPKLSPKEMDDSIRAVKKLQADLQEKQAKQNLQRSKRFLAENLRLSGVKETKSGLQYKILTPGSGEIPKKTDTIIAHYKGTLIDGSVFDSSYRRGKPFTTPVTRVIKGWTEALQMMKVGAKWRLFVPPHLAYGSRSPSQDIPANSALIFDLELLDIKGEKESLKMAPAQSDKNGKKKKPQSSAVKTNRM